tara:strand:- start:2775 stop:3071 length:297 start_codon:yes stop_codon:yes gene_type:complete
MEEIKKRGGAREGAGRPKKDITEQANSIIRYAIKELYNKDSDEDAQKEFVKDFAKTPRGMQFVAEHLFGKAPQIIEQEGAMFIQTPLIEFVSENKDKR